MLWPVVILTENVLPLLSCRKSVAIVHRKCCGKCTQKTCGQLCTQKMLWPSLYTQQICGYNCTHKKCCGHCHTHRKCHGNCTCRNSLCTREHTVTIAIRTFISRAAKLSDNALQIVNVIYHCATNYKCNLTTQFTKSNSGVMYYPCHCTLLSNLRLQQHEMVRDLLTSFCNTPQQLGFGCLSLPLPPTHPQTLMHIHYPPPPPPLTHMMRQISVPNCLWLQKKAKKKKPCCPNIMFIYCCWEHKASGSVLLTFCARGIFCYLRTKTVVC